MTEQFQAIRKYNLWDGHKSPTGLQRTFYTEKIIQFMGNSLVKVLVGQRRSGKSYILRQLMISLTEKGINPSNILYISKEFIDYNFIDSFEILETFYQSYISELSPKEKIYLFIDEVQTIDGWEKFVNSHSQDFTAEVEIIISGSNSKMLSSELATLLSGRYVQYQIYPFGY